MTDGKQYKVKLTNFINRYSSGHEWVKEECKYFEGYELNSLLVQAEESKENIRAKVEVFILTIEMKPVEVYVPYDMYGRTREGEEYYNEGGIPRY